MRSWLYRLSWTPREACLQVLGELVLGAVLVCLQAIYPASAEGLLGSWVHTVSLHSLEAKDSPDAPIPHESFP